MPLEEGTNIAILEDIISHQRQILTDVFNGTDITTVPQVWTLCKLPFTRRYIVFFYHRLFRSGSTSIL